jgi:hypothetical protein
LEVVAHVASTEYCRGEIAAAFTTGVRGRPEAVDLAALDTLPEAHTVAIEVVYGSRQHTYAAPLMVNQPPAPGPPCARRRPYVVDGEGWVHAFVPSFPGEGKIRLVYRGTEIASVTKSATPPGLEDVHRSLLTNGASTLGYEYSWRGVDPDDSRTRIAVFVQASYDGGETWRVVERTEGNRVLVPCHRVAGRKTARIRLIASDGINQAVAFTEDELVQVENDPCARPAGR